jgi:hypothetical protein
MERLHFYPEPFGLDRLQPPNLLLLGINIVVLDFATVHTPCRYPPLEGAGYGTQEQPSLGGIAIRARANDMQVTRSAHEPT